MKIEKYKCDVCGTEKTETNHWFATTRAGTRLILTSLEDARNMEASTVTHLCGETCALKQVSLYLEKRHD